MSNHAPPTPKHVVEMNDTRIAAFITGNEMDEIKLSERSQPPTPDDPHDSAKLLMGVLFQAQELVALVNGIRIAGRITPAGETFTVPASQLMSELDDEAGRDALCLHKREWYFRINPVNGPGSGVRGFHKAGDMARYRHTLVEMDHAGKDIQIRLLTRLPIPIVAMIDSGNRSIHAIVRVDATDWEDFKNRTARIKRALTPLGCDPGVFHANILSRLPGSARLDRGTKHRLLYLNTTPTNQPIAK